MQSLADVLRSKNIGEVSSTSEDLEKFSRDASLFYMRPQVIITPRNTTEVQALVRFASSEEGRQLGINLTPRLAGSDMSGGPLGSSVIVDMMRYFNNLVELGDGYAVVQPGMMYRDFDRATEAQSLQLPSYTASREMNTVGGMVANDSGGEKNLRYGKTARYVQELEVVMADGQAHTLCALGPKELEMACTQKDFLGGVYRGLRKILREKGDLIQSAKPHVEKNSSGYALWRMRDEKKDTLDLAQLMVGAQGTLGIITKIKFNLIKPKPYSSMAVIFLKDLSKLGKIITAVLAHEPDSFESYDDHTFKLAVKYFPEFTKQLRKNILRLSISFFPEAWMLLTGGMPKLALLVEFTADDQNTAEQKARAVVEEMHNTFKAKAHLARNAEAAQKYWAIRRESFNLLRHKLRGLRTAPFIDDFVVPPTVFPEFLPKLEALLDKYDFTYTIAGHVGDGNFHIIPLVDPNDPTIPEMVDKLSHLVYDLVLGYHGSITGEHNDGLVRTPYVEKMFGSEMYQLFLEVKKLFDPLGIFNPRKKVGLDFQEMKKYLDLPGKK